MAKSSRPPGTKKMSTKNKSTVRNSRTTVSGPAEPDASGAGDIAAEKAAATQDARVRVSLQSEQGGRIRPRRGARAA